MTISKLAALSSLALLAASPASAADIFSDNFDGYAAEVLNWNGGGTWDITSGSVDLVGTPNGYGITCAGGSGKCVDLIGTLPGAATNGKMISSSSFFLDVGSYLFSFDYSGNQRGAASSSFEAFVSDGGNTPYTVLLGPLASNAPFTTHSAIFAVGTAGNYSITFNQASGPGNIGNLLDNVRLATVEATPNAAVPEPATWAMMLLGFGFVGGFMRSNARRRKLLTACA